MSAFSVSPEVLAGLSDAEAVEAFRDLLWARAQQIGVATTAVSVWSELYAADGGIDAAFLGEAPVRDDELLKVGTRFKIKTGDFRPWRRSVVMKELYKGKPPGPTSLGAAVRRTLGEGGRYVICCFGVDPPDEKLRQARDNFVAEFSACGYPAADVEVWRQTQLVGLFDAYPSLCLRLRGHDQLGFQPHASWRSNADMSPVVHFSPEHQQTIEGLRDELRNGAVGHLRLTGEPGVGKTRTALELTGSDDLAPVTLYVPDAGMLLRSSFVNELIQADDHRFAVLVVDECPPKDRASIWNLLKPRSARIRLVTIDHAADQSGDDRTRVEAVSPAGPEQIVAILEDYGVGDLEARRWAAFCEGCPRVAHVLGENLRSDTDSLLRPPATVDVWDRFIIGRDDRQSEGALERRRVLRYVSLFERFGFEPPVGEEAEFIAGLAGVPWGRFQDVVHDLRRRRILQGIRTLYITPRLLHMYLYREFWETDGRSTDVTERLADMPGDLRPWFVEMLRYAHDSSAERAVDALLRRSGFSPRAESPYGDPSDGLIVALAESFPGQTLRYLRRTLGARDIDALRRLTRGRQQLVWALERIAVWAEYFAGAASLLLSLAEAENATNSNNATGTFRNLFSLIPGMAATQADFAARFPVIEDALNAENPGRRRIGLLACETALSRTAGGRIIGPEHQGLRRAVDFWGPETWEELRECQARVWELLLGKLGTWGGEDRRALTATLIEAGSSLLHVDRFSASVLRTLWALSADPATDVKQLLTSIRWHLRRDSGKLPPAVRQELEAVFEGLEGHDFPSRLRRVVRHATWEDLYDEEAKRTTSLEERLDGLVDQAVAAPGLLDSELPWLVREGSGPAFAFGYRVGQRDTGCGLLERIVRRQSADMDAPVSFLGGYLAGVRQRDAAEWETTLLRLAEAPEIAGRFSDLAIGSGLTDRVARRAIDLCREGTGDPRRLEHWWYSPQLRSLSPGLFEELLVFQLEEGSGRLWGNAVHMCHTYYIDRDGAKPLPEELLLRVLTHEGEADDRAVHQAAYYWSKLSAAFLRQYPARIWDLFAGVLDASSRGVDLGDLDGGEERVLTGIVREHPEAAFRHVTDAVGRCGDLAGADFWRNKGRVRHVRFFEHPKGGTGGGSFTAENAYETDEETICIEECRITVSVRPEGYLLDWASTFRSDQGDLAFGDQEEMGLGVRVATPLAVVNGGRITDSEGHENEPQVWGKQADWCEYGGLSGGRRVGVVLMPDPRNFGRSWFHARDYGLLVANPFGRNAFTGGETSRVTVEKGDEFRLRFGVLVYGVPEGESPDIHAVFRSYVGK